MKERKFKLTNIAVNNLKTVYIFTSILIILGIWSYNNTPKELAPDIVFPYFSIATVYPGTSPADMENLVTRPIEKQLKSINGIKEISSKSIQDFSMIFVEFETNVDNNIAYQDVKEAVDKAKPELPENLLDDPEVRKIEISEFPIVNINLSGDLGLVKLKEYADDLQEQIESLEEITRVDIVGALEKEYQIKVDLYKMQAAGITFQQIETAVAMENMTISTGQLKSDGIRKTIRVVGEFQDEKQIQNILLKDGVYIRDIADVVEGYADRESYARLFSKDVITLNVIKKGGENLIISIDKVKEIIKAFEKDASSNLEITITGDNSTWTRNMVSNLFNTIILGFLIVVIVLMFFMGVDNALFVGVSIPLSMIITFIFIKISGITLNMVVLMALILVLGIIVDNSIVVVENIYRHFMKTKNLPIRPASKRGVGEVATTVFSGTLTTIAPFVPLLFWPGIMGEFMSYIPITLIITLTASMIVAYTMNPVFAVSFMKYRGNEKRPPANQKKSAILYAFFIMLAGILYFTKVFVLANLIVFFILAILIIRFGLKPLIKRFQKRFIPKMIRGYERSLRFFIKGRRPYWVMVGILLLFVFTIFLFAAKPPKVILFSETEPSTIDIYVRMPSGTDIEVTNAVTRKIEKQIYDIVGKNNPDLESVVTNVAIGAGQNNFEQGMAQPQLGKITVTFVEYQFRTGPSTETYLKEMRQKINNIPGAEIVVDVQQMGPPTGKPINIEISGDNIDSLIQISDRLKVFIEEKNIGGIEELKSDMEQNLPEININIDRQKANKLGVNTVYVGMLINTALYGKDISAIREGEDEYDINLRLKEEYRNDVNKLLNMQVMTPGGPKGVRMIPVYSFASVEKSNAIGGIIRKDGKRVITLSSNVLSGYNANEIVQRLKRLLPNFEKPSNYSIAFTGEQEDQAETSQFLGFAMFMAIALIFVILVAQFNSMSKTLIILSQILFSIIGVFLGILIFNMDMSIVMSGMGIIAVAGIVVKNAIILIDYTDMQIKKPGKIRSAIIHAGAIRLTPVILTAASTILGLLPLALAMNLDFNGLFTQFDPNIYFGGDSASFWKPVAWTIIFGLTFATFLTLVVVPSMYFIAYAMKLKINRRRQYRKILFQKNYIEN